MANEKLIKKIEKLWKKGEINFGQYRAMMALAMRGKANGKREA